MYVGFFLLLFFLFCWSCESKVRTTNTQNSCALPDLHSPSNYNSSQPCNICLSLGCVWCESDETPFCSNGSIPCVGYAINGSPSLCNGGVNNFMLILLVVVLVPCSTVALCCVFAFSLKMRKYLCCNFSRKPNEFSRRVDCESNARSNVSPVDFVKIMPLDTVTTKDLPVARAVVCDSDTEAAYNAIAVVST